MGRSRSTASPLASIPPLPNAVTDRRQPRRRSRRGRQRPGLSMDVIIRPATPDDDEAICEVLDEVDALHREALPHIFRKPDGHVRVDILDQVAGATTWASSL
jgi:hypothetical protein